MSVNGANGVNAATTVAQARKNLEARGVNVTEDALRAEIARLSSPQNQDKGLTVEKTGAEKVAPRELTSDEVLIKNMLLQDKNMGIANCKSMAELNALIQDMAAYPGLMGDKDVQAALKAKRAELNPPAPKKAEVKQKGFNCEAEWTKLYNTKTSGETIQLQIEAEKTKQNILKDVQKIDIESAKGYEPQHQGIVEQFVGVAVDGQKPAKNAPESLRNIEGTKLTDEQKEALRADLEEIAAMDLPALCKDFGIDINMDKLENLGEDVTHEKVTEQANYVAGLLAQIQGQEGKTPTGLAKVRADLAAADKNIANNNKTIAKYDQIRKDMIKNGEIKEDDPDPNASSVGALQNANMAALKVVVKAEGTLASVKPLEQRLIALYEKLHIADVDMNNIEKFDDGCEGRKAEQARNEDKYLAKEEKEVAGAQKKRDKQVGKMTDAKFSNDKNLNELEASDAKANKKTDKKFEKVQAAQGELAQDIKDRDAIKAIVDARTEKQKELDELRKKEEPEEVEETP